MVLVGSLALALSGCASGTRTGATSKPHSSVGSGGKPATSSSKGGGGGTTGGDVTTTTAPAGGGAPKGTATSCLASGAASAAANQPDLTAVQFLSSSQGWIAGPGRILATSDGGAHWVSQLSSANRIGSVDFVSSQAGWAVANTHLLGTTDGGACWHYLGEPAQPLRQVHFVSPSQGWGIAGGGLTLGAGGAVSGESGVPVPPQSGGVLAQTANGGATWALDSSAPTNAQSVCFATPSQGWLAASGVIYRSSDGGASWTAVDNTNPHGTNGPYFDRVSLQCAGPSSVWAVADTLQVAAGNQPWALLHSTDGTNFAVVLQNQFSPTGPFGVSPPGSYPGPFSSISPTAVAVAGYTPARATNPAGVVVLNGTSHGSPVPATGIGMPTGLAFTSPTQGWVVGTVSPSGAGPAVVESTSNGGATWSVQAQVP